MSVQFAFKDSRPRPGGCSVRRRRSRAGVGLADTVGLLVFVGLLLSLSAVILHRVLQSQGNAMEYLAVTQNLQAAHERWSYDTLTSMKCEVGEDLRITCTDGRVISYGLEAGQLVRSTAERTGPEAGYQVVGQEHWQLPPGCQVGWSIDRGHRVPLVECSLGVPHHPPMRWVSRAEVAAAGVSQP